MPMIDSFAFRHEKYLCAGTLEPEKLPPSERAAHYHGLRVHLQVIEWKVFDASANLNVEEWGWRIEIDCFNPVTTGKPVAPDNVLKLYGVNANLRPNISVDQMFARFERMG